MRVCRPRATLRVGYCRLANRHLNSTLVGDLTGKVMKAGGALIDEQPFIPHGRR
jgi:hypothetical protein